LNGAQSAANRLHFAGLRSKKRRFGRCWMGTDCYSPASFDLGTDMAAQNDSHGDSHGEYKLGSMDMSQHYKAYAGFLGFAKWSLIGVGLIMIFMALFRTH
jgi:Bacterial aa3 type cytochrome c oxidase subunit IV